uniref:Uncharacterized protein n=1 Tax=Glossina brevipalpis TaxID=37001 RepID=A0A1A9WBT9_9MUSC
MKMKMKMKIRHVVLQQSIKFLSSLFLFCNLVIYLFSHLRMRNVDGIEKALVRTESGMQSLSPFHVSLPSGAIFTLDLQMTDRAKICVRYLNSIFTVTGFPLVCKTPVQIQYLTIR